MADRALYVLLIQALMAILDLQLGLPANSLANSPSGSFLILSLRGTMHTNDYEKSE